MARLILFVVLVLAVFVPVAAVAQEYGPSLGDLEGVPDAAYAGESIPLEGSGFAVGSMVEVSLMANEVGEIDSLGTVEVDGEGNVTGSVSLSEAVAPGSYTISVSGDAVDGGVRELSAALHVAVTTTTTAPATTMSATADTDAALAGSDEEGVEAGADAVEGDDVAVAGDGGDGEGDVAVAGGPIGDDSAGNNLPYLLGGLVVLVLVAAGALGWRVRKQRS